MQFRRYNSFLLGDKLHKQESSYNEKFVALAHGAKNISVGQQHALANATHNNTINVSVTGDINRPHELAKTTAQEVGKVLKNIPRVLK